MFDAEPFSAGAPEAGLHLVANEQASVAVDDFRGPLEVAGRRNDVTPDTLNCLSQERGRFPTGGGLDGVFEVVAELVDAALIARRLEGAAVGIRRHDVRDSRNRGRQGTPGGMCGEVGGQHTATRVAVSEGNHLTPAGVHARHHDRGFHRLCAAVREERPAQLSRSYGGESLRHLHLVLAKVQCGDVAQGAELFPDAFHNLGVTVPQRRREDAAEEVEELISLRVDDPGSLSLHQDERIGVIGRCAGEQVFAKPSLHRCGIGCRRCFQTCH